MTSVANKKCSTTRSTSSLRRLLPAFLIPLCSLQADSPEVSAGVLGRAGNLDYQKGITTAKTATAQDVRRVDVDAGGQPAGTAISDTYASADFSRLHLSILTKATAEIVSGNFWGHSASGSANASMHDILTFQLPGSPAQTEVWVSLIFQVDANVSSVNASAQIEGTLQLRSTDDKQAEIRYFNGGTPSPIDTMVLNYQENPLKITHGDSTVLLKVLTGVPYILDAIIQGSASAAADINPGMAEESHIRFSQGIVDAANTAHIGLNPITPGLKVISSAKATYDFVAGPILVSSLSPEGPYSAVGNAISTPATRQFLVPLSHETRFFRISATSATPIQSVRFENDQLILVY